VSALAAGAYRTPEDRFEGLADYPFTPRYVTVQAEGTDPLRMHYAEAGPADGPVALLVHGQPTWSYLYRHTLGVLGDRGMRALAPDNIGFGRSDKPRRRTDYTFARHVAWTVGFVEALDLHDVTLVVHDWGGPIGLSALAARPERFGRIVATNTVLHTADPALDGVLAWANHGTGPGRVVHEEALLDYVAYCARVPELVPSTLLYAARGTLGDEARRAYDAPFPDAEASAGLRQMTALIPLTRNDPGAVIGRATMEALRRWEQPLLTVYSDADPATAGWERVFQEQVPGAAGHEHVTVPGVGHFLPEEAGAELGAVVADFSDRTR